MRVTRRTYRWSVAGFTVIALLVLGGLTWATVASLELARAQARLDQQKALNVALWRMDSRLFRVLGHEESREYGHYRWAYCSTNILHAGGCEGSSPIVVEREQGRMQDWILLHFQVSGAEGWQSPEVTDSNEPESTEQYLWLKRLEAGLSLDELPRALADAERLANPDQAVISRPDSSRGFPLASVGLRKEHGPASGPMAMPVAPATIHQGEFAQRLEQRQLASQASVPKESCDPAELAYRGLGLSAPFLDPRDSDDDEASDVAVQPSPLLPIWLTLPEVGRTLLAYVRRVAVGTEVVYQGFLVDWDQLSEILLADVSDLFPRAQLVPVESRHITEPETRMISLPARLVVGEAPLAAMEERQTFLHATLALVWLGSLAVLIAVGLGVRNLLAFAERRLQFAYAVTHELRTPLTTLRLYTDMLANDGIRDEETRHEYLQTVDQETQRLAELVSGVLEYARVENQAVRLDRRPISVGEIVESARRRCEPVCARAGQAFVTDVNGISPETVHTDRQVVLQILEILVDNACKYGKSETDPRVVLRALRQPDGRLALEVQDHGPGVASRDRRRIFRPFRRGGPGEAHPVGGIGLGLALARRWAGLLGARIDLLPSPSGACFRFTFPICRESGYLKRIRQ